MNKFQNSKEFNEIIKNLNDKNFSKAIEKIDSISKKYKNENIILKLYAVTYFNLMEWEKAIKYFKKNLTFEQAKYKIHTNIGVSYFKLGKINQSIKAFKNSIKENPNFGLAYNNLGISYLELGMFDKAVDQFISALKLNDYDDVAKTKLINTFNLIRPKADDKHQLIKINNKINNLVKENDINCGYNNNYIKTLLEKSNQLINGYMKNLCLNETQIFRKNSENLNCGRHFKIFNEFNVIPKYCFGCYKIQINLKTVVDLIKLFFIFNKIKLKRNNIRKCIIENRNKIQGNYKGYIYCKEIAEAEKIKKMINEMITQEDIGLDNITLKHGCSEFYESYPEFKKINPNGEREMEYDNEWKSFEEIIDSREPKRIETDKKIWSKSIEGINLSDILIINNWISYAQIIGDESYKKVYEKKIENAFVNKFLKNQLEFRKKELKI
tara:strand:+ start:176 stop:1492 length:1317 start_codon:yes stop_codon:yes gene_type:complete